RRPWLAAGYKEPRGAPLVLAAWRATGHLRRLMNRVRLVIFNAALGPLDYRVPEGMAVEPGSVVVAPLGPRQIVGIVWEADRLPATEVPEAKLRPLLGLLPVPPLRAE